MNLIDLLCVYRAINNVGSATVFIVQKVFYNQTVFIAMHNCQLLIGTVMYMMITVRD